MKRNPAGTERAPAKPRAGKTRRQQLAEGKTVPNRVRDKKDPLEGKRASELPAKLALQAIQRERGAQKTSLKRHVGTLEQPYARPDGQELVKWTPQIWIEVRQELDAFIADQPRHARRNDLYSLIVREGIRVLSAQSHGRASAAE